jgi:N-formylglutamate deformylase
MSETPPTNGERAYANLLAGPCGVTPDARAVFDLALPDALGVPFLYNSPHSGRFYPADLMALTGLDENLIRGSEDYFVDLLFAAAPRLGAPLLKALYPRAYIDTNREPYELDPQMFLGDLPDFVTKSSPRIAAGLGTIPKVVAPGCNIYPGKIAFAEAMSRIERIYMPYHRALAALADHMEEVFGGFIMIDCHSMPSSSGPSSSGPSSSGPSSSGPSSSGPSSSGPISSRTISQQQSLRGVDIVLGDRHSQSCATALADTAERLFRDLGYNVGRNDPYAGGYNAYRYGRPANGRHVLQVEISRSLYINEKSLEPTGNFTRLARDLEIWMAALHQEASGLGDDLSFARVFPPKAAE